MHKLSSNKDGTLLKMDLRNSLINRCFYKSWKLSFPLLKALEPQVDQSLGADSKVKDGFLRIKQC